MEHRAHDFTNQRCKGTARERSAVRKHRQEQLANAGIEAAVLERDAGRGNPLSFVCQTGKLRPF